jgi:hypothetical protein
VLSENGIRKVPMVAEAHTLKLSQKCTKWQAVWSVLPLNLSSLIWSLNGESWPLQWSLRNKVKTSGKSITVHFKGICIMNPQWRKTTDNWLGLETIMPKNFPDIEVNSMTGWYDVIDLDKCSVLVNWFEILGRDCIGKHLCMWFTIGSSESQRLSIQISNWSCDALSLLEVKMKFFFFFFFFLKIYCISLSFYVTYWT